MTLLTLILGVHRSGTSLLTNGLALAGVSLGDFADVHDADNPDGYAEHPLIRDFNDRLLAHLGVSWDNWGFRASTVDFAAAPFAAWRDEAAALLRAAFTGPGPFALKDPRITGLLAFWEIVAPLAGFDLRRILVLRDPVEVAISQTQRVARRLQGFSVIAAAEPMAALWAVTMYEALGALRDDQTLIVHHADLLATPAQTLTAAATFAGGNPQPESIARQVKPSLHRARAADASAPPGEWMTVATKLYAAFGPAGTPHPLTMAQARTLRRAQARLAGLVKGLEAVKASIQRMQAVHAQQDLRSTRQDALLWNLNRLIHRVPDPDLQSVADRLTETLSDTAAPYDGLALTFIVARILLATGRHDEATLWLTSAQDRFGHMRIFQDLQTDPASKP